MMARIGWRIVGNIGLILWCAQLFALRQVQTAPLTLHDCIVLALTQQTDMRVGQSSIEAAQATVTQARSSYFPQISVQTATNLVQVGTSAEFLTGNSTSAAQQGLTSGSILSLTQNLYDGGLREASLANAKDQVVQAKSTLLRTQQTVIYSVTKAYLGLLRAQDLKKVTTQQVDYIVGQLQQVQSRIDAGDAADVDALPIKAQLATARVAALTAKNNISTAAIQLQQSMGLMPVETFAIQDIAAPSVLVMAKYDGYLATALKQRPELVLHQANINAAQSGVKTAKINMLPRPVISGQLDQPVGGGGGNMQAYGISAGIVYDLFDGQNNRSVYRTAKANLRSAQARADQVPKDITADVQTAYLTRITAQERVKACALSVEATQQNFAAQTERYQRGLAIPLDLLNAQLAVTTAQSDAVQALYDDLTALAQLHYALGNTGEVTWEK
jgi:outer membrane protein TolC